MGVFNVRAEHSSQPLADVEYRFDSTKGVFFASYSDEDFESTVREELRKSVEACVRSRTQIDYIPMIEVNVPSDYRSPGYKHTPKHEISLSFCLVLVSKQVFEHGLRKDRYNLTRQAFVDETGTVKATNTTATDDRRWESENKPWDVLLPYTPARFEALTAIQEAIGRTRQHLIELIGDARLVDQVAINGAARIRLIGA